MTEVRGDKRSVLSLGHPVEQLVNADFLFFLNIIQHYWLEENNTTNTRGGWGGGGGYVALGKDNLYQSHSF